MRAVLELRQHELALPIWQQGNFVFRPLIGLNVNEQKIHKKRIFHTHTYIPMMRLMLLSNAGMYSAKQRYKGICSDPISFETKMQAYCTAGHGDKSLYPIICISVHCRTSEHPQLPSYDDSVCLRGSHYEI